MKQLNGSFAASDYVTQAAYAGPTPRGLESATMSMSDIPEDANPEDVFADIEKEVEFARSLVLGKMATNRTKLGS